MEQPNTKTMTLMMGQPNAVVNNLRVCGKTDQSGARCRVECHTVVDIARLRPFPLSLGRHLWPFVLPSPHTLGYESLGS